jgi:glycosyltransferase involved in cell wall biosynthesis
VDTIRHLQARGYEVEVFTSAYRGGGNTSFAGIPVHRFRYFFRSGERLTHEEPVPDRIRHRPWYAPLLFFYLVGGIVAIRRLVRTQRYDVVHVHWPLPHAVFGAAARQVSGAPVIAQFYSVELRWVRHGLPFLRGFIRWAITSANRVVAISTSTADEIRLVAPVPVAVIPYSVELPTLPPESALRRSAGGDSGIASRASRILFVGRLVPRKGVTYLLGALAELPQTASLTIIGDGPERAALEAQAIALALGDRVTFRGWVSNDALRESYLDTSIFVLPAVVDERGDTEGLGVVLLEAMSFGIPVVASAVGGITDVVVHEETGLLVPPNDARALAAAITRLATDTALAERLGRAGEARVRDQFGWPRIMAQWDELYGGLAHR